MAFNAHHQVLLAAFAIALVMGAVANKTRFCTLGAVSDWINIGDTGRMRAWLLAMAVAIAGVLTLQASGLASLSSDTFPPYRTPTFAWVRYLLGGFLFGIGMTLASGCGSKTLIRLGAGSVKSLIALIAAAICAYLMIWTEFYATAFHWWIAPTQMDLAQYGMHSQAIGDIVAGFGNFSDGARLNAWLGWILAAAIAFFAFASRDFRTSFDNILGGVVVGLAIVGGWYVTAGALGQEWKELAQMSALPPSRVASQSYTFISPMADGLRYLSRPGDSSLVNFGIMGLTGLSAGSLLYALASRTFRFERFSSWTDFASHAGGGALMGTGGVLAMGCTIGQAITGVSTLALGSFLAFAAIVAGSVATMKVQYWWMPREDGTPARSAA
jgi:uncharacterized membrane protein YedE/YeeE